MGIVANVLVFFITGICHLLRGSFIGNFLHIWLKNYLLVLKCRLRSISMECIRNVKISIILPQEWDYKRFFRLRQKLDKTPKKNPKEISRRIHIIFTFPLKISDPYPSHQRGSHGWQDNESLRSRFYSSFHSFYHLHLGNRCDAAFLWDIRFSHNWGSLKRRGCALDTKLLGRWYFMLYSGAWFTSETQ